MKKIGKLSLIAKTGGVKIEGDESWYNPIPSLVEEFIELKDTDYKGMAIDMEIEKGKKDFIIIEFDVKESPQETKGSPENNKSDKILFQVCIKVAGMQIKGDPKDIIRYAKELYNLTK